MNALFDGYIEWQGEFRTGLTGALASDRNGVHDTVTLCITCRSAENSLCWLTHP